MKGREEPSSRKEPSCFRRLSDAHLVGVISDTHGLIRPGISKIFKGVDMIIHAGDIGSPEVLASLQQVAPVIAVRGNVDKGQWSRELCETQFIEVKHLSLYVLHDLKELDLNPAAAGFRAVISGHSHRPSIEERNGVLYVNPGSAGPRRLKLPVPVALLHIQHNALDAQLIELEP